MRKQGKRKCKHARNGVQNAKRRQEKAIPGNHIFERGSKLCLNEKERLTEKEKKGCGWVWQKPFGTRVVLPTLGEGEEKEQLMIQSDLILLIWLEKKKCIWLMKPATCWGIRLMKRPCPELRICDQTMESSSPPKVQPLSAAPALIGWLRSDPAESPERGAGACGGDLRSRRVEWWAALRSARLSHVAGGKSVAQRRTHVAEIDLLWNCCNLSDSFFFYIYLFLECGGPVPLCGRLDDEVQWLSMAHACMTHFYICCLTAGGWGHRWVFARLHVSVLK